MRGYPVRSCTRVHRGMWEWGEGGYRLRAHDVNATYAYRLARARRGHACAETEPVRVSRADMCTGRLPDPLPASAGRERASTGAQRCDTRPRARIRTSSCPRAQKKPERAPDTYTRNTGVRARVPRRWQLVRPSEMHLDYRDLSPIPSRRCADAAAPRS